MATHAGLLTAPRTEAPADRRTVTAVVAGAPLAAVMLVGAVLRLWSFDRVGANPFYDAAVRSMGLSWHNFFFGAFEPGGQVSIDKAPADLWLQVASVKLFGFSGVATRLPEVAAGVVAIPLLYALVRRLFGRTAGLGAAAAMAVLPAAILTAHSDTMDSVMMLLDVLAAWLVVVGAQSRRAWPVVAAGAVLGLAFNVKLFQALIITPALIVLMVLAVQLPIRRRIAVLGGSLAAFLAVGLGWIVAASMTPLSGRPWPIGSTDGSIWSVVFGFNGIDRLRSPASNAALKLDPPGLLRFFGSSGHHYAATVGSMLLAALVLGAAAGAVAMVGSNPRSEGRRLRVVGAAFFGVWLLIGAGLLSHMQRMQPRYLEAVTPAIAAVVGIGVARLATDGGERRMAALALAGAGAVAAAGGVLIAHPPWWAALLALAATTGAALAAVVVSPRRRATALVAFGLVAVLAVPGWAALNVARAHASDAGLPSRMPAAQVVQLSRFLTSHQGSARYEVASPTVVRAAPLIVRDGRPVLMLTSINGRPLLGAQQLQRLVAAGQVRYALLGRGACTGHAAGGCAPAVRWAVGHGRDVGGPNGLPHGVLYRLSVAPTQASGR
jgi:4-amino-4-deoxy-L-arabinose transferase-like glycosyltransferase